MKLFVANIPYNKGNKDLQNLFTPFGTVKYARIIMDTTLGRSKGFGFVELDDAGGQAAIDALDGSDWDGRAVVVRVATERR